MMERRSFLAGAAAYALPGQGSDSLHFRILRNGTPVGDHFLQFRGSGGDFTVALAARVRVTFAAIPVFHYAVKAVEVWRGGVFQQIDSRVDYNGTALTVHAARVAGGYHVEGTNVPGYLAPPDLLPLTYWNKAMMNATILNIQTAHCYPAQVHSPGWSAVPVATGGSVVAQRFDLSGKLHMSLWYDQQNRWAGLEFQRDGDIFYQKFV